MRTVEKRVRAHARACASVKCACARMHVHAQIISERTKHALKKAAAIFASKCYGSSNLLGK